jgi:hypothetical protein
MRKESQAQHESRRSLQFFTNLITVNEPLEIKSAKGGLSCYKNDVFVCHFNAQPQKKRDDLGFADFRYDALRLYLEIEELMKH